MTDCVRGVSKTVSSFPSFIEVYLIYKIVHILSTYILMSLNIGIYHATIPTVKVINISVTFKRFLVPPCFFKFVVKTQEIYPLTK